MILNLTEHSREPMHRQMSRQLRWRILGGSVDAGAEVQPRTLARQHRMSVVSVQRALDHLAADGLLQSQPEGHFLVAEVNASQRRELAQERLMERLDDGEISAKELTLARDIQCRLLPPPRLDADGWTVVARNEPARFVAGDFYDILRHGDGTVDLVVADVAGKGIGPSLIMASFKAILPFLTTARSVVEVLDELNRRLCQELGRREFIALALARFFPNSGRLEVANAGLPDPYLLRRDAKGNPKPEAVVVPGERLPLGLRSRVRYSSASVTLQPGDRFLLLTDGLPEASRDDGEPFGYERLEEHLGRTWRDPPHRDAETWLDAMLDALRNQTAILLDDDWTTMVLERRR